MSVSIQSLSQLNSRAKDALIQELGVVDALRFLNQMRAGSGDYSAEREQLFKGETVKSLAAEIRGWAPPGATKD